MQRLISLGFFIISLTFLSGCSTTSSHKPSPRPKLTILFMNDTHGHYLSHKVDGIPGVGGFASLSTLIKEIREEIKPNKGKLLVLHGGDFNTGTLKSNLYNAAPDIEAMNHIQVDATAIGEHELAKPLKVLKNQMEKAEFPFISSNIFEKKNGNFLGKPYLVTKVNKSDIYIFGLTTLQAKEHMPKLRGNKLRLYSPLKTATSYSNKFPKNSIVILLSHLGHKSDLRLARQNPNIDIILGGHSHSITRVPRIVGNALVIQAGKHLEGAARIDLVVKNGLVIDYRYRYIPLNHKIKERHGKSSKLIPLDKVIKEDETLLKKLKPFDLSFPEELSKKIGINKTLLTKNSSERSELPLGNLIADSILNKAKCDISLVGSHEIKADLLEGPITTNDLINLHSTNDTITITKLNGNQLVDLLESLYTSKDFFMQLAGMTINLEYNFEGNASVIIKSIGGRYSKPNAIYSLCSSSSLLMNKAVAKHFKKFRNRLDTRLPIYESIVDYVKSKKTIDYEMENRITINPLN